MQEEQQQAREEQRVKEEQQLARQPQPQPQRQQSPPVVPLPPAEVEGRTAALVTGHPEPSGVDHQGPSFRAAAPAPAAAVASSSAPATASAAPPAPPPAASTSAPAPTLLQLMPLWTECLQSGLAHTMSEVLGRLKDLLAEFPAQQWPETASSFAMAARQLRSALDELGRADAGARERVLSSIQMAAGLTASILAQQLEDLRGRAREAAT